LHDGQLNSDSYMAVGIDLTDSIIKLLNSSKVIYGYYWKQRLFRQFVILPPVFFL